MALELESAKRAGLLLHWMRLEPPMRGLGGGKFAPRGDGPPDYLAITREGVGAYIECKSLSARAHLEYGHVKPHQASDLSVLPGSLVVVRWEAEGATLALPWSALGPLWREHARRIGRAKAGEGSCTLDQARALGVELAHGRQHLGHVVVDEVRRAWMDT